MVTFVVGLVILIVGGFFYGGFTEKLFGPDDRKTPAYRLENGVDFVPMDKKKNSLIQLLNIAGTGPILGPIQGILFGPVAFILIPLGCVLAGGIHDYMSGMISIRENGDQMPDLIKKFLGKRIFYVYLVFLCLLMLLVGSVFIYTPGDLMVGQVLNLSVSPNNFVVWLVYGIIFIYYLVATLFPIDKIIGKIYPIFGVVLLLSALGIFMGIFLKGYTLNELSFSNILGIHPQGLNVIPMFFVTVACGILSGFHSTQSTLIARSVKHEKEGRNTFYNMMMIEGFIAMTWAAAAMGIYNKGIDAKFIGTASVVGIVAKDFLGNFGGIIAILGVIVLPITSGDTALRSLRLMIADFFKFDQKPAKNRVIVSACIFVPVIIILVYAKLNANGFNILWRYFAWSNQTIGVFAFAMITVYLMKVKKAYFPALIPGMFYCFIVSSYILNAKIGFNIPLNLAYIISIVIVAAYGFLTVRTGNSKMNIGEKLAD